MLTDGWCIYCLNWLTSWCITLKFKHILFKRNGLAGLQWNTLSKMSVYWNVRLHTLHCNFFNEYTVTSLMCIGQRLLLFIIVWRSTCSFHFPWWLCEFSAAESEIAAHWLRRMSNDRNLLLATRNRRKDAGKCVVVGNEESCANSLIMIHIHIIMLYLLLSL